MSTLPFPDGRAAFPRGGSGFRIRGKSAVRSRRLNARTIAAVRNGIRLSFLVICSALLLFVTVAALRTAFLLRDLDRDLIALARHRSGRATLLYASDNTLLARVTRENRQFVPFDRIPEALRNATVAAEDRRFWSHHGVDPRGLARALWRDVRKRRAAEGGSTITMQLVRNIRLSPEKTMQRKLREAALAHRLEKIHSKRKILETYLNEVHYGSGAYGVGAAAAVYFRAPVEKLTVAQCALLATIPRRPTAYHPHRDPGGALTRRNRLLKQMGELGTLHSRQLAAALAEPLGVRPPRPRPGKAPYFVDAVVDQLVDRYGSDAVYDGGLKVHTTLNPALQEAAEQALVRGVRALRVRNVSQGAMIVIDPATGGVKAMVGGVRHASSPFNRALRARRQPGSTFKPFVYAAAFDAGMSPHDRVTDRPIRVKVNGAIWRPVNHTGRYAGQTTLVNAFAQSMNVPAVRLGLSVGMPRVVATARSCGIRSPLRSFSSLPLGTSEVTLTELTGAYSTFATGGFHAEPYLIRSVRSADGRIDEILGSRPYPVLDPLTARKVDYMLRETVRRGTARSVASIRGARGKTGTTQENRDAWFIGYTPELAAGVWLGNDRPFPMRGVRGGNGAGPIWRSFMSDALRRVPRRSPPPFYSPPAPRPERPLTAQREGDDAAMESPAVTAPEWEEPNGTEEPILQPTVVPRATEEEAWADAYGGERNRLARVDAAPPVEAVSSHASPMP